VNDIKYEITKAGLKFYDDKDLYCYKDFVQHRPEYQSECSVRLWHILGWTLTFVTYFILDSWYSAYPGPILNFALLYNTALLPCAIALIVANAIGAYDCSIYINQMDAKNAQDYEKKIADYANAKQFVKEQSQHLSAENLIELVFHSQLEIWAKTILEAEMRNRKPKQPY